MNNTIDLQNKKIGAVTAINDFGAGGLVEIKFDDEKYNKNQINNFAFTHKIFPEVDIAKGYLIFDMPDIVEILENE
jgi:ribosomal 30S subunit maturation factor RimM